MNKLNGLLMCGLLLIFLGSGCAANGNAPGKYATTPTEAEWIRNGEPLQFENEMWYPADIIENLLDDEVYLMGEYRGVQIFTERNDVRPFERVYTKFSTHKFRAFEKKSADDKS
jgi:hypothetical protein